MLHALVEIRLDIIMYYLEAQDSKENVIMVVITGIRTQVGVDILRLVRKTLYISTA